MARTTIKHVRQMAENVSKNMRKVGYLRDNQSLVLIEAERQYGTPYRLHTTTDGQPGYGDTGLLPGGNGFLGHTAAEATRALEIINTGLITQYDREQMRTLSALKTPKFVGSASGEKQEGGE